MSFQTVTELGEESVIECPVVFTGKGLHTGELNTVSVQNNPNEDGIFFKRDGVYTKLDPHKVDNSGRTTSLIDDHGEVLAITIEHILSAFYALRIRNVYVNLQGGPEIPILNGASDVFLEALNKARRSVQKQVDFVTLDESFEIHDESDHGRYIRLDPGIAPYVEIRSYAKYPNSPLKPQSYNFQYGDAEDYTREIAPAGTSYPFYLDSDEDVRILFDRLKGLVHEGPNRNVHIFDPRYFSDCTVPTHVSRHKILDFLGDMHTLNLPLLDGIIVTLNNTGHRLNNQLARSISLDTLYA